MILASSLKTRKIDERMTHFACLFLVWNEIPFEGLRGFLIFRKPKKKKIDKIMELQTRRVLC